MPSFLESLTAPTKERAQAQLEARMRGVPWGPMEAMDMMGAADEGVDRSVWEPLAEGAGRLSSKTDSALLQALLQSAGAGASMAGSVFLAPSNLVPGPGDDAARAVKAIPKTKAAIIDALKNIGMGEAEINAAKSRLGKTGLEALYKRKVLNNAIKDLTDEERNALYLSHVSTLRGNDPLTPEQFSNMSGGQLAGLNSPYWKEGQQVVFVPRHLSLEGSTSVPKIPSGYRASEDEVFILGKNYPIK